MKIPLYQYDAFADRVFSGNPAAICPLGDWLSDDVMQRIAAENNVSETAFFVDEDDSYSLRWFTPKMEVNLCGHATLAAAAVIFDHINDGADRVAFDSNAGTLTVAKADGGVLEMDFPAWELEEREVPWELTEAIGGGHVIGRNRDILMRFGTEEEIEELTPDMAWLADLLRGSGGGVIVTARAHKDSGYDFVSRFFAPQAGIPEDPVTGSAHCTLTPYWSAELGKKELVARQLSPRGGTIFCRDLGERVVIGGRCVSYLEGTITV